MEIVVVVIEVEILVVMGIVVVLHHHPSPLTPLKAVSPPALRRPEAFCGCPLMYTCLEYLFVSIYF